MALAETTSGEHHSFSVLVVVGVGTLLSALASSTVNLALPTLGRELHISLEDSRWVVLAFLLAVGVFLLVAGRLGDLMGHRRVYLGGFFLFGVTSLGCGLSPSFEMLVVFRLLQGLGGAMIMATGPALLTTSFPARMRGRALGMLATATYTGLTFGPPAGGFIVSHLGWRWTFFFNVPITLVVLLMGWRFLAQRGSEKRMPFDLRGTFCLLVGLPLLFIFISEGQRWGAGSWVTWVVAGGGVAGMVAFVLVQRNRAVSLLDLRLFRSRVFAGAVVRALANYVALSVLVILMPFCLEEGLGRETSEVGLVLMVQPLVMAVVASPSGWLSDRIGSRGLAVVGMLILAGGIVGLSFLDAGSTTVQIIGLLGVVGLGTGIFISPNSSALMGAAPRQQQGTAGGVLAEARVLGMLVGVAAPTALFQAAGGRTGNTWRPEEFDAMQLAFRVAGGVALFGAFATGLRGD